MRIAVLSPAYPSENSSGFSFVHARVRTYRDAGHEVLVMVPGSGAGWEFEGVSVQEVTSGSASQVVADWKADVLAIHFPNHAVKKVASGIRLPRVVWIHGHEVLWTTNIASKARSPLVWLKKRVLLFPRLIHQSLHTGRFIRRSQVSVFVSQWMKSASERHCASKFRNSMVIPNPVDTDFFSYKRPEVANKGISVRGFGSNKYGNDIAIKAFAKNKVATLDMYGSGRFYQKLRELAKREQSSAELHQVVMNHEQIRDLYHEHSFFVAASRVEAQGVAMCEAMSTGLPVVATHVGGIPEFVRDGVDGYLVAPDDPVALGEAIEKLVADHDGLVAMGRKAREQMEHKCAVPVIREMELEALRKAMEIWKDSDGE